MTGIINYGVGNLFSLKCSLAYIGIDACVTGDTDEIARCERLILPGVGAFSDAAEALRSRGLDKAVINEAASGKPLLGICLGMQMMFDKSFEFGVYNGLSLIPGSVVPIKPLVGNRKVPQIGWNALSFPEKKSAIYKYTDNGAYVYFVHSYHAECDARFVSATTEYGAILTASAENGNVYATQFHPEKSGETGLDILRAFCEI